MAIWEMFWVAVEGVRVHGGPAAPHGAAGQGPAARAGAEDPRGDDMGSWALGKVGGGWAGTARARWCSRGPDAVRSVKKLPACFVEWRRMPHMSCKVF